MWTLRARLLASIVLGFGLAFLAACQDITVYDSATCDGEVNQGEDTVDSLFDADGDGFFDGANPGCQETYAVEDLDCDDGDAEVHPGASELACNGVDDDCDPGTVDDVDVDGDGAGECDDCDDADGSNTPGGTEVCDGADNDCNGVADFGGFSEADGDSDGSLDCDDCDDADGSNTPGGTEVCDGADNDCNGVADLPGELEDLDCDSAVACADCDDEDARVLPGAAEVCDGLDTDCDPSTAAGGALGETDGDGDGVFPCAGDCADGDSSAYGADYATEVLEASPLAYWRLGDPTNACLAADQLGALPLENIGVDFGTTGALVNDPDTAVTMPAPVDANDHRYLVYDGLPLSTQAVSVEFWIRTSVIHTTAFSYAIMGQSNELTIVFDEVASHFVYVDSAPKRPNFPIADGQWHHVVQTWQASDGQVEIWVDGLVAWSAIVAVGGTLDPGGCMVLGAEQDSRCGGFDTGQALQGDLDEVALYTRVLDPAEILLHYEVGAGIDTGVGCP